jgi:tetratricopeptide (TPR) repeat protein
MEKNHLDSLAQWHKEGEFDKIIDLIKNLSPEELNYDTKSQLARAYNNRDNYKDAIELLFEIKAEGKEDPLWHFRVGYAYYYLDQIIDAQKAFEESLLLNPSDEDCKTFLDYINQELILNPLIENNEYDKIISFIEKIPQEKTNYMLIMELAKAYNATNRYKETVEKLLLFKDHGQVDPSWNNIIGYAYYNLDELEKALEAIDMVNKAYPENENIIQLLKSIQNELMIKPLWAKNEYNKIIEYISKLPQEEKNYLLINNLARAYSKIGDFTSVIKQLSTVEENGEGDPHWHYRIGHAYYYEDELEKAKNQFEKVLKLINKDETIEAFLLWIKHELHIKILINEKRYQEVIDYIKNLT